MTTLPRCPFKGCPVRYRDGGDRLCPEHQDEQGVWPDRMTEWTGIMTAPGQDGSDPQDPSSWLP